MPDNRFVIKDKLISVAGSLTITDDLGQPAYEVDGTLVAVGRKVTLRSLDGQDRLILQHKLSHLHKTVEISGPDGGTVAVVQKTLAGIHHTYKVDVTGGPALEVHGDLVDHDFTVTAGDADVAHVTRAWVTIRDTYGVEVAPGQDTPLVLAVVLAVDVIEHILTEERENASH